MSHNANLTPTNVRKGVNVGGVVGSLLESPMSMSSPVTTAYISVPNSKEVIFTVTVPANTKAVILTKGQSSIEEITSNNYIRELPWTGAAPVYPPNSSSTEVEARRVSLSGTTLSIAAYRVSGTGGNRAVFSVLPLC